MSSPRDGLDLKGCPREEEGPETATGAATRNPPGRAALERRIGTRADFLARMLDRLTSETLPDGPRAGSRPLVGLASRESDDPAVALLDAWAGLGDVLTFYQERIANEGYLRTALERRSVLELARLAGQELGSGVAASAFLDFTVEDAPGAPLTVLVPQGTQVQSIPGQNELPQTFETAEDFTAHAAWNALIPRQGRRQRPESLAGARELFLAGIDLRLSAGDVLLLIVHPRPAVDAPGLSVRPTIARIGGVALDIDRQLTRVTLEEPLALGFSEDTLRTSAIEVFAFREKTAFFGHNAPRWGSLPRTDVQRTELYAGEAGDWDAGRTIWTDSMSVPYLEGSEVASAEPAVFLDRKLSGIVEGSWLLFVGRGVRFSEPLWQAYRIAGHLEATRADYAIVGETTGLGIGSAAGEGLPQVAERPEFDVRRTTAYLVSEPLVLAERPVDAPYPSLEEDGGLAVMTLDRRVEGLRPGQTLVFRGTRTAGGTASRLALVQQVEEDPKDPGHTRLVLQQPMPAGLFLRAGLTVRANIVLATHGETVAEVLGSGDSSQPHQRFFLRNLPLTWVSAPVPGGRASTLAVRVDGVLWREVETLYGEGGESQAYMVEIADGGRTAVRFGDGRQGARLPTGTENVTAVYRSGVGLPGMVAADTLQLLVTRPLGIREVTNPLPAAGGAPPDTVERARADAPVAARTQGRIVSLSDFEDFARTFAGVAKVEARPVAGVHLTVAGEGGAAVERGSALYTNMVRAIQAARLPGPPLTISSYERVPFLVTAQLVIDRRFRPEDVFSRARAALLAAFSFERRSLGQPVHASDVVAALQAVAGVVAVDLDALRVEGSPAGLTSPLVAQPALSSGGQVRPAQLLVLEPGGIDLRAKTS